jgi:hypothetical protein
LVAYRPAEVHSRPPPRGEGHSCSRASGTKGAPRHHARIDLGENSTPPARDFPVGRWRRTLAGELFSGRLLVYLVAYRPAEVHRRPPPRGEGHSCSRASGTKGAPRHHARIEIWLHRFLGSRRYFSFHRNHARNIHQTTVINPKQTNSLANIVFNVVLESVTEHVGAQP